VVKSTGFYPRVRFDTVGSGVVSHAGAVVLIETIRALGLDRVLSAALAPWRRPLARHDPAKVLLDLAVATAVGGDCLADIAVLRSDPGVFGPVASDPTVSRVIDGLAGDADRVLAAINRVRAAARALAWRRADRLAPDHGIDADDPLIIDVDATLVTAHSEKERAAPTFKHGYGFHPLVAFVDHGAGGTGEPVAMRLRPGNAGSNTAADHLRVIRDALRQLPFPTAGRVGRKVLVRTDAAGCTHQVVDWLTARRLSYSLGFTLSPDIVERIGRIPQTAWTPAYDADEQPRDGAWVADATGVLDLTGWPPGMRVLVRAERPHPGAQLRFTDLHGHRLTAFATNTRRGQLADLELRHRRRARCEDRIRGAKDTGLSNLPLHDFAQNQIWLAIIALALDITAWMQLLAFRDDPARRWEPKRLRLRILSVAGRLARHARQVRLHLPRHAPWRKLITIGLARLHAPPTAA
jgi:Transposase DDE domain group 1